MADDEISEQDLVEALSRLQVSDLLVQTLSTVGKPRCGRTLHQSWVCSVTEPVS